MPVCSQCSQEKARDAFTKVQLRKTGAAAKTRLCKQCVDPFSDVVENAIKVNKNAMKQNSKAMKIRGSASLYEPPPPPPRPVPLPATEKSRVQVLIRIAAIRIMKRGIPPDVGLDGFTKEELEARLWEVVGDQRTSWLTIPLMAGLAYGEPKINEKMHFYPGQEPHPIIMWVCQHKNLKSQFDYCGGDDIVALVISAGAAVSLRVSNGCNALFFAVKYGTVRTVELLLDAGVKVNKRDVFGNSIWTNAIERPDLKVINLLIDRCSDLIPADKEIISHTGIRLKYTLPEEMLNRYVGFGSENQRPSWIILGAPKLDEMASALIRVLKAGAKFSQANKCRPELSFSHPLAFVTHVDTPGSDRYTKNYGKTQLVIARTLRDVIYGRWLPEETMKEVQSVNHTCEPDNTCPICLTEMEQSDNPITLYCGHRYCLECIQDYGQFRPQAEPTYRFESIRVNANGQLRDVRILAEGADKRCPVCRRLLCGDLLDQDYNQRYRRFGGMRLGIDRHEAGRELSSSTPRGPHLLSDEQLRFECKVMIGKTEGTRELLLEELQQFQSRASSSLVGMEDKTLELTCCEIVVSGFYTPLCGAALIPIHVKGIPILASLSPNSMFTVIPRAVVKMFGLKTKPIQSSQFVTSIGTRHVDVAEVVDEFRFFLKDVEICLNNAVVLKDEVWFNRSVQLGKDFFESALWTRSSVRVRGDTFAVSDCGYTKDLFLKDQPDELRYYSRDGKICQVPFIYVHDLGCKKAFPVVSLPGDISFKFGECQWCCRCFPCDGMVNHDDDVSSTSFRFYCDEECKSKGVAIRSR